MIFPIKLISGVMVMFLSTCAGYCLHEDDTKVFYALWMVAGIFLIGVLWC